MKTTLRTSTPNWWRAANTCPTISAAVRLRSKPIFPVRQKRHPMRHPTWLETHRVCRRNMGMTTDSMSRSSDNRVTNLRTPPSDTRLTNRPVDTARPDSRSPASQESGQRRPGDQGSCSHASSHAGIPPCDMGSLAVSVVKGIGKLDCASGRLFSMGRANFSLTFIVFLSIPYVIGRKKQH
jgi:hypothetical protein